MIIIIVLIIGFIVWQLLFGQGMRAERSVISNNGGIKKMYDELIDTLSNGAYLIKTSQTKDTYHFVVSDREYFTHYFVIQHRGNLLTIKWKYGVIGSNWKHEQSWTYSGGSQMGIGLKIIQEIEVIIDRPYSVGISVGDIRDL